MLVGFALLVAGLVLWTWFNRNAQKSDLHRPLFFDRPVLVAIGTLVWIGLLIAGLGIIFSSSRMAGIWVAIILVVVWLIGKFGGSPKQTAKVMMRSYEILRAKYPNEEEHQILYRVFKARYPTWDDERIGQEVGNNKNIHDLTNHVLFLETGKLPSLFQEE